MFVKLATADGAEGGVIDCPAMGVCDTRESEDSVGGCRDEDAGMRTDSVVVLIMVSVELP